MPAAAAVYRNDLYYLAARWHDLADGARHVIQIVLIHRILSPRVLSRMTSYDVVSIICQVLRPGAPPRTCTARRWNASSLVVAVEEPRRGRRQRLLCRFWLG